MLKLPSWSDVLLIIQMALKWLSLFYGTEETLRKHGTAMYVLTAVSDLHELRITGWSSTSPTCWYSYF